MAYFSSSNGAMYWRTDSNRVTGEEASEVVHLDWWPSSVTVGRQHAFWYQIFGWPGDYRDQLRSAEIETQTSSGKKVRVSFRVKSEWATSDSFRAQYGSNYRWLLLGIDVKSSDTGVSNGDTLEARYLSLKSGNVWATTHGLTQIGIDLRVTNTVLVRASNYAKIAKATNWSLTSSQSSLTTTTLEDTDRTVIPGVRTTTGSCTVFYYQESRGNNSNNYCSQLINTLMKARSDTDVGDEGIAASPEQVMLRFNVDDGSNAEEGGRFVEFDALLTSAAINMGVGEIFSAQIGFDVIGAPRRVTI